VEEKEGGLMAEAHAQLISVNVQKKLPQKEQAGNLKGQENLRRTCPKTNTVGEVGGKKNRQDHLHSPKLSG